MVFVGFLISGMGYGLSVLAHGFSLSPGRIGASLFIGVVMLVLMLNFFGAIGLTFLMFTTIPVSLLFVLIRLSLSEKYFFGKAERMDPEAPPGDRPLLLGSLLVLLSIYFFAIWRMVGYDELYNFFFASQVARGKCPPGFFAFPEYTANYHYGWGILLGWIASISGFDLTLISDILTLFMLLICALMCWEVLTLLGISKNSKPMGAILFFLGGGFFILPAGLILGDWRGGMGTLTMFQSHPWTFGMCYFFYIIMLMQRILRKEKPFIYYLPLFIPLLAIPVVNATSISFVGCSLLILALIAIYSRQDIAFLKRRLFLAILVLAIIIAAWQYMGGVFSQAPPNGWPVERGYAGLTAPLFSLGFQNYFKYMAAYSLMAPAGILGFIISIRLIFILRMRLFDQKNAALLLLIVSSLLLFPYPYFLWFKQFPAWDNLCKFSYFGVLSGWLLIIYYLDHKIFMQNHFFKNKMIVIVFLAFLFGHESIINCFRFNIQNDHMAFREQTENNQSLIDFIRSDVHINSKILILNNKMKSFYLPEMISGEKTNLYKYLREHYSPFTHVAMMTGGAFVNFQNGTRAIPGSRLYQIIEFLNAVNSEGISYNALAKERIAYILCRLNRVPSAVYELENNGFLDKTKVNEKENWGIWKVRYES